MKKFFVFLRLLILLSFFSSTLFAAEAKGKFFSWDFSDCEIKDILFAVSMDTGISILADDTVSGKCDLRFIGNDFERAFDAFLQANRLYLEKSEDLWKVSRFRFSCEDGLFYLDAHELLPAVLIEKLSQKIESVITYENLPSAKISLHLKGLTEKELMENLAKCFGAYEVLPGLKGFHFAKKKENQKFVSDGFGYINIFGNEENGFSVDIKEGKFSEALEKLFLLAPQKKQQFCILGGSDVKIQRSLFFENDFERTLEKLSSQSGYKFLLADDVYYFLSDSDAKNNIAFGEKSWEAFSLKFLKPEVFIPLVSKQIGNFESFVLSNKNGFYAFITQSQKEVIENLIESVDEKIGVHVVNLRYLKPEEMLKHLPPFIDKNSLVLADDNSCLYFTGTEENYQNLCQQLEQFDRPTVAISYDLLILQYDESSQNSWNPGISADKMVMGDRNSVSAVLGNVMNLNMNVVGAFGMTFAASLQNSIEENHTKVFADTRLHGVSGKKINFQNTNTYRYRDNNLDPETGKPVYSGVTREITSGIKLEVLGWVSGDGMITSSVTASLTRQGIDTSSSTGNPPPTTEKIVTTEVRGKSGEPVVLSGLIQNSDTKEEKGAAGLSKIPLLGWLFKKRSKIKEQSQMVIYLVPNIEEAEVRFANENPYGKEWAAGKLARLIES